MLGDSDTTALRRFRAGVGATESILDSSIGLLVLESRIERRTGAGLTTDMAVGPCGGVASWLVRWRWIYYPNSLAAKTTKWAIKRRCSW